MSITTRVVSSPSTVRVLSYVSSTKTCTLLSVDWAQNISDNNLTSKTALPWNNRCYRHLGQWHRHSFFVLSINLLKILKSNQLNLSSSILYCSCFSFLHLTLTLSVYQSKTWLNHNTKFFTFKYKVNWVPSYKHMVSNTIALLMTHSSLSFRPENPTVAARISGRLADISAWMKEHHLQLNLAKTELLVLPATPTLQHDFTIQLGSSTSTPSSSVRNLGVIYDDQLTFKPVCTTSERSGPSLHSMQHNFLSRPLPFIDWTTAMLF